MQRQVERCGDVMWLGEAMEWVILHACVVGKNQEGYLRSEGSQAKARPHSAGF